MTTVTNQPAIEIIHELLADGFQYLFATASRRGHWEEVRCTALAAMCLRLRDDGQSNWSDALRSWLESQQIQEGQGAGSWGEELWDTAMCVLALKALQVKTRKASVDDALQWMSSLFSVNGRGNWHDEPWETSWALLAILRAGRVPPGVDCGGALRWLCGLQATDGLLVAPHYSAYLLLLDSFAEKVRLDDSDRKLLHAARTRSAQYLLAELEHSSAQILWTGEAWSNGQILWALAEARAFPIGSGDLTNKVIEWFKATQEPAGNWRDVEDTASAILGLHQLLLRLYEVSGVTSEMAEEKARRRLCQGAPLPRLALPRLLIERDPESGYVSINLAERTVRYGFWLVTFFFVGLVGWIANVVALIDKVLKR